MFLNIANFSLLFSLYIRSQLKSQTNGSVIYCLLFLQRQECFHKQQSSRVAQGKRPSFPFVLLASIIISEQSIGKKNRNTPHRVVVGLFRPNNKPKPFQFQVVNATINQCRYLVCGWKERNNPNPPTKTVYMYRCVCVCGYI